MRPIRSLVASLIVVTMLCLTAVTVTAKTKMVRANQATITQTQIEKALPRIAVDVGLMLMPDDYPIMNAPTLTFGAPEPATVYIGNQLRPPSNQRSHGSLMRLEPAPCQRE